MRLLLTVSAVALLAGCVNLHPTKDAEFKGQADKADTMNASLRKPTVYSPVTYSDVPYYGSKFVQSTHGDTLPPKTIRISAGHSYSLSDLAREITAQTGIPVRVEDASPSGGSGGGAAGASLPPQLGQVLDYANGGAATPGAAPAPYSGPRIVPSYDGNVEGFLELAGSNFDLDWSYKQGVVTVSRFVSKVYAIPAAPPINTISATLSGATSEDGGGSGGGSSSGGATSGQTTQDMGATAQLDIYTDIDNALKRLIPSTGDYYLSRSTRQAIVYAPPTAIRRVDQYVENLRKTLSPRIEIDVDTIYVDVNDTDNYGFDLNLAFQNSRGVAAGLVGLVPSIVNVPGSQSVSIVNAPAGSKLAHFNGSQAVIQALSEINKLADYHHLATITQNDQPAPMQFVTRQDYLKSVSFNTVGNSTTAASTSATPDTINYGTGLQVLPSIVDGNLVDVFLTLTNTDAPTFTNADAGNGTSIQLAKQPKRGLQHRLQLLSGQTQILGLFDEIVATGDDKGTGAAQSLLLGGQQTAGTHRVRLFLAVTATILPPPHQSPEATGTL